MTVLLIGRNLALLQMLASVLRARGVSVELAGDPSSALCRLADRPPRVAVLDYEEDSAFDLAGAGKETVVCLLTSRLGPARRQFPGAEVYLKPYDLSLLADRVLALAGADSPAASPLRG